jgi:5-formyltetrahydrofolate cyclo-ligase
VRLKQQLRQRIREKRSRLTLEEQRHYAQKITFHLLRQAEFVRARHIALYMAFNNEVSTERILAYGLTQHKVCYLPILQNDNHLQFVKINHCSHLGKNKYGILEPDSTNAHIVAPHQLDLVLVPLVAFDDAFHRLGMGGGYYDRTFAFKRRQKKGPLLVGLGYEFQRLKHVPHSNLDVSLDMAVTEKQRY